jgi:hypothetical protein
MKKFKRYCKWKFCHRSGEMQLRINSFNNYLLNKYIY